MKNLDQITQPIAAELAQFEAFFEKTLRADSEPMDSIMQYVRKTRGKRLRPIMVLLSAKLYGKVNERTLRAATFVEMVHTATLIHDDVVDDDDLRRGQASVKAQWNSRTAVLAGDYLLAQAMLLISQPDDHEILQEMLRTSAAMSEGELMQNQSLSPSKELATDTYLDVITHKTATLMRSCCAAGALSVGVTPEELRFISDFGFHFGILFQLRDDMLDGENIRLAQDLLPFYYRRMQQILEALPHSEITTALSDLTEFCILRGE